MNDKTLQRKAYDLYNDAKEVIDNLIEKIDNLEFQVFKMKIEYPNKMVLNLLMYSRLFGKKEFTVNIMYVDNKKGQLMTEAWKNSKFLKQ